MKTFRRPLVLTLLSIIALIIAALFALAVYSNLEKQNILDELFLRRQLSAAGEAIRNVLENEYRLIRNSWGYRFNEALSDWQGEIPDLTIGSTMSDLIDELIDPTLIADWVVFEPVKNLFFIYETDHFMIVEPPSWLQAALNSGPDRPFEFFAGTAWSSDFQTAPAVRPQNEPGFSPNLPVIIPQTMMVPTAERQLKLAVKLDMDRLRNSLIPNLSERYFHNYGESGVVKTAVFVYNKGFPPETINADAVFPLDFGYYPSPIQKPGFDSNWQDGDWGMMVRYGTNGIKGLMTAKRRVNGLSCTALFLILAIGIILTYLATRRKDQSQQRERDFIALFSHELKTPLAIIGSTAQNLASGLYVSTDDVHDHAGVIVKANRRLSDLVNTILAIASGEVRQGERLDLGILTAETIEKASAFAAAHDATIQYSPPSKSCIVNGDSQALSGAIDALLTNAIRYGRPKDGPHRIKVQVFRNDVTSFPPFRKTRSYAYIVVSDRGPGVPRSDIRRAKAGRIGKTPEGVVTQSSGDAGRSGLGLPLAIKTFRALGGRIRFERWPGACVMAIIPLERS